MESVEMFCVRLYAQPTLQFRSSRAPSHNPRDVLKASLLFCRKLFTRTPPGARRPGSTSHPNHGNLARLPKFVSVPDGSEISPSWYSRDGPYLGIRVLEERDPSPEVHEARPADHAAVLRVVGLRERHVDVVVVQQRDLDEDPCEIGDLADQFRQTAAAVESARPASSPSVPAPAWLPLRALPRRPRAPEAAHPGPRACLSNSGSNSCFIRKFIERLMFEFHPADFPRSPRVSVFCQE